MFLIPSSVSGLVHEWIEFNWLELQRIIKPKPSLRSWSAIFQEYVPLGHDTDMGRGDNWLRRESLRTTIIYIDVCIEFD
jgi:hypothetical protein